ncbi:MAG: hypothetical protein IT267_05845 [Saprospiraceae bacterium]|nr:hypothetical protein [Saprospiraceae bacterium]
MLKAILGWLGFVGNELVSQQTQQVEIRSDFKLLRIVNFKSEFVARRNIEILLPQNYDTNVKYKVVYLQDGQNLFDSLVAFQGEAMELQTILKNYFIDDVIIVGIWNTKKRYREYLGNTIYNALSRKNRKFIKREYGGIAQGDSYMNFLIKELIPYVEKEYSVSSQKDGRLIGGMSMGALISLYIALHYPEKFGGLLCMSTHWPLSVKKQKPSISEEYISILGSKLSLLKDTRIYFDYGTENIDAWYSVPQENFNRLVEDYNITNYKCIQFSGASHLMSDWRLRIGPALKWVLSE